MRDVERCGLYVPIIAVWVDVRVLWLGRTTWIPCLTGLMSVRGRSTWMCCCRTSFASSLSGQGWSKKWPVVPVLATTGADVRCYVILLHACRVGSFVSLCSVI